MVESVSPRKLQSSWPNPDQQFTFRYGFPALTMRLPRISVPNKWDVSRHPLSIAFCSPVWYATWGNLDRQEYVVRVVETIGKHDEDIACTETRS
jgi:hypothetical protein